MVENALLLTDPVKPGLFYKHLCDYFIYSFINYIILLFSIFKTLSIPNYKSWGADILREYLYIVLLSKP